MRGNWGGMSLVPFRFPATISPFSIGNIPLSFSFWNCLNLSNLLFREGSPYQFSPFSWPLPESRTPRFPFSFWVGFFPPGHQKQTLPWKNSQTKLPPFPSHRNYRIHTSSSSQFFPTFFFKMKKMPPFALNVLFRLAAGAPSPHFCPPPFCRFHIRKRGFSFFGPGFRGKNPFFSPSRSAAHFSLLFPPFSPILPKNNSPCNRKKKWVFFPFLACRGQWSSPLSLFFCPFSGGMDSGFFFLLPDRVAVFFSLPLAAIWADSPFLFFYLGTNFSSFEWVEYWFFFFEFKPGGVSSPWVWDVPLPFVSPNRPSEVGMTFFFGMKKAKWLSSFPWAVQVPSFFPLSSRALAPSNGLSWISWGTQQSFFPFPPFFPYSSPPSLSFFLLPCFLPL